MICPKCQSQINDGAKFCHICGAALIGDNAYNVDNEVTVSAVDNGRFTARAAQAATPITLSGMNSFRTKTVSM